jgi:hypothetical protein
VCGQIHVLLPLLMPPATIGTEHSFLIRPSKTYEAMHLSFPIRRANISGILLLFDAVCPRTMLYLLSKRAALHRAFAVLTRAL